MGGTPTPHGHMGGGVTPSMKKEKGGVGGYPLPPLSAKRHFFCMAKTCVSRGIAVVNLGVGGFLAGFRVTRPGPEGEGGAHRARHMGGGGNPLQEKEKGGVGGSPPPPLARKNDPCRYIP